jgi:hypothetical protein
MVKNLNTIERSERIRIGKYTPDEQAINSIIINASSEILEANTSGFHVTPIRKDSSVLSNTLVYNTVTKEIVDSGENADKSLEDVTSTWKYHTIYRGISKCKYKFGYSGFSWYSKCKSCTYPRCGNEVLYRREWVKCYGCHR